MLCDVQPAASAAMAGDEISADMAMCTDSEVSKLRGTKIFVSVEEALIDVLIVSYQCESKVFQGALLDVTKKNSPYGIPFIRPWDTTPDLSTPAASIDDRFTSLRQRHTYNQQERPNDCQETSMKSKKPIGRTIRDQGVRMRRLRPRQVLCSHCRSICNENSENVQHENTTKKANKDSWAPITIQDTKLTQDEDQHGQSKTLTPVQTNSVPEVDSSRPVESAVVPKIEPEQDLRCNLSVYGLIRPSEGEPDKTSNEYQAVQQNQLSSRMILRKRKSDDMGHNCSGCVVHPKNRRFETIISQEKYGPMEGSDATVGTTQTKSAIAKTSPVIKISFSNPEGRDTILKIPARLQSASDTEEGGTTPNWISGDDRTVNGASAATKAARKALKKAKKDAQKKYASGQQHKSRHHHKHKTKRKRKHKDLIDDDLPQLLPPNQDNYYEEVKNKCLRQKLSISLKRLNAKAYMRCAEKRERMEMEDEENAGGGTEGSSGSEYGDVPEFPVHELMKPLMMRITSHNVKKCVLENGREMAVGDIVWGKIHGFPWWPGKVLALTVSQRDNGVTINRQAHVAWFGSSTSSYMPCSQLSPFLNDFKTRYNKKKRGPYKEAIRQATLEAKQNNHQLVNVTANVTAANRQDKPNTM